MAGGNPVTARGTVCPACGADAWIHSDGNRCHPCWVRHRMFHNAKGRARARGRTFTITPEDILSVWPVDNRCPALGIILAPGHTRGGQPDSPTLDRIDPNRGYEVGNIAVISSLANRVKGSSTPEDLERIAQWMRGQGVN